MPDLIGLSQTWIANWATGIVAVLPFGYAFGAGMVSTVNPCGFAMLPAYLSLYMGAAEENPAPRAPILRVGKALLIGSAVTLGFVALFGVIGLGIAAGGQFLTRAMPWAGLAAGVALVAVGVLLLAGKHVYSGLVARLAARVKAPRTGGVQAFFLFGIGYAIASLACTLPVFLVVVGSAIAVRGVLPGFLQFISYALGMGVVLVALTLGMALFKEATVSYFRGMLPHVQRLSAVLVLLMGSYLVYYWLTKGDLLRYFT